MAATKPANAAPEAAAIAPEQQLVTMLEKSKSQLVPAAVVILVLLAAAVALGMADRSRRERAAAAYALLRQAESDQPPPQPSEERNEALTKRKASLEQVLSQYPDSAAAADAAFLLAETEYQLGNYSVAGEKFAAFAKDYPNHPPLTARARLSQAACLLADGQPEKALAAYRAIAADAARDGSSTAAEATYRGALCAITLGNHDEARKMLEDVAVLDGVTESIKEQAGEILQTLQVIPADRFKAALEATTPEKPDAEKTPEQEAPTPPPDAPADEDSE